MLNAAKLPQWDLRKVVFARDSTNRITSLIINTTSKFAPADQAETSVFITYILPETFPLTKLSEQLNAVSAVYLCVSSLMFFDKAANQ